MEATNRLSKVNIIDLAGFILQHYGPMSQLKLQKLLFYCEAYHLAKFEEPLTDENFEAWMHGPVSPKIFHTLKEHSLIYSDIRFTGKEDMKKKIQDSVTSSQFEVLTDVLEDLSSWSGNELEAATHSELPWIEARVGYGDADRCNVVINKETMMKFYQKELSGRK